MYLLNEYNLKEMMAFSWHSKLQKYEIANYTYIIHCFHMVAG